MTATPHNPGQTLWNNRRLNKRSRDELIKVADTLLSQVATDRSEIDTWVKECDSLKNKLSVAHIQANSWEEKYKESQKSLASALRDMEALRISNESHDKQHAQARAALYELIDERVHVSRLHQRYITALVVLGGALFVWGTFFNRATTWFPGLRHAVGL